MDTTTPTTEAVNLDALVTISEYAQIRCIGRATVYRAIKDGRIHVTAIGLDKSHRFIDLSRYGDVHISRQ